MHLGRRRTFRSVAAGAALLMGGAFIATVGATPAGSAPPGVQPKSVTALLAPGGSTSIEKTITTPEQPPKLDVYFLSDTTGSMSPTLANVQTNTAAILTAVSGGSPDVRFGEIAIIDEGPRSADVVANVESVLLKISAAALKRLFQEAPALAAPFLLALSKTITGRVRTLTKRYEDSIHFARVANEK